MKTNIIGILRSRLTPVILGLLMVAAVPIGFAKQADAAWACAPGLICLYSDINYGGDVVNFSISTPGCYNIGSQFNDKISSIHNYLSRNVQVNWDSNCSGVVYRIHSGDSWSSMPGWWNDEVSSFYVE